MGGRPLRAVAAGPATDCAAPCIARDLGFMRLSWDTPYDRAEAEPVLRQVFRRKLDAEPAGGGAGSQPLAQPRRGDRDARRGREVTFVAYAPDVALAATGLA